MSGGAADAAGRSAGGRRSALACLLLLVLAGALLHVPRERVALFFDIQGYTAQAASLLEGRGNTIRVGETDIPGIYPAGLPLLLLPPLTLLGPDMRHGAWTLLAFALLAVGGAFVAARRFGRGTAAGLAGGLLLLGSPMFRAMSGQIMTQVPTGAVILAVVLLFSDRRGGGRLFVAGLLASLSLLLRYANVTFPLALGLAELVGGGRREGGRMRSLLLLGGGMAAGAAIVAAHNAWVFGGAARTGYDVWGYELGFSLSNILWPAGAPGRPDEHWVIVRALAGFGGGGEAGARDVALQPPWLALAAVVGLVACWREGRADPSARRFATAAFLTLLLQAFFLALYAFRSTNYLLPGVPVTAALAGVGAARLVGRRAWIAPALALVLLASSVWRTPALTDTEELAISRHDSFAVAAELLEPDAVLITTMDPGGMAEPLLRSRHPARSLLYLGPYVSPVVAEASLAELGGGPCTAASVFDYAQRQTLAGRAVYLDYNPPPRDLTGEHRAIVKRLKQGFSLEPTAAPNIRRLVPAQGS